MIQQHSRCSFGHVDRSADLALECRSVSECLATALVEARQGVRCGRVLLGSRAFIVAAAYLSTPSTVVENASAFLSERSLSHDRFNPGFLVSLPPLVLAEQLARAEVPIVIPRSHRATFWGGEGPHPEFVSGKCSVCADVGHLTVHVIEQVEAMLALQHSSQRGKTASSSFIRNGLAALFANDTVVINRPDRVLAHVLIGPFGFDGNFGIERGSFGVVVSDTDGWHGFLSVASGANMKTATLPGWSSFVPGLDEEQDDTMRTLTAATPHRANFVIIPHGVLESVGLNTSLGKWDLHADVRLMKATARALGNGGHVFVTVDVGKACIVLRCLSSGTASRIYSAKGIQELFRDWRVLEQYSLPVRTSGPCQSRPHVFVLKHAWDRHPLSLLTVKRVDILPKVLYAVHYRGVATRREDRSKRLPWRGGKWARDLYISASARMGSIAEHCRFDNALSSDLCKRKYGAVEFEQEFDFLIKSLEFMGLSRAVSELRLDNKGILLNGAHRVAVSLARGVRSVPVKPTSLDLYHVGDMDQTALLMNLNPLEAATLLLELARRLDHPEAVWQLYVAFVWPAARAEGLVPRLAASFEAVGYLVEVQGSELQLGRVGSELVCRQLQASKGQSAPISPCSYASGFETDAQSTRSVEVTTSMGTVLLLERPKFPPLDMKKLTTSFPELMSLCVECLFMTVHPKEVEMAISTLLYPPTVAFLQASERFERRVELPRPDLLNQLGSAARNHCILDGDAVLHVHGLLRLPSRSDDDQAATSPELTTAAVGALDIVCDGEVDLPELAGLVDHSTDEPWITLHGVESPADVVHRLGGYFTLEGWRIVAPAEFVAFRRRSRLQKAAANPADDEFVVALERLYQERFS
eukprot:TRINITY_DN41804_c0_g1_i1.p1 TRINITY_DN41804_c0_g1~~TRINITY_DN41804_c0_g1_i1.p1  ORF type:complete len:868 (+),score=101.68 TRINITY_DN41804_c0_g1_i1:37-2640(+)